MFFRPDYRKTTKRTGFKRDGEKHVELSLDAGQSFYSLGLFSVDMYFRTNVTYAAVSRYDADKSNFVHFVNSVR